MRDVFPPAHQHQIKSCLLSNRCPAPIRRLVVAFRPRKDYRMRGTLGPVTYHSAESKRAEDYSNTIGVFSLLRSPMPRAGGLRSCKRSFRGRIFLCCHWITSSAIPCIRSLRVAALYVQRNGLKHFNMFRYGYSAQYWMLLHKSPSYHSSGFFSCGHLQDK